MAQAVSRVRQTSYPESAKAIFDALPAFVPPARRVAPLVPAMKGGYQSLYIERVLQAADPDFLVGCRGHAVPRESH